MRHQPLPHSASYVTWRAHSTEAPGRLPEASAFSIGAMDGQSLTYMIVLCTG